MELAAGTVGQLELLEDAVQAVEDQVWAVRSRVAVVAGVEDLCCSLGWLLSLVVLVLRAAAIAALLARHRKRCRHTSSLLRLFVVFEDLSAV